MSVERVDTPDFLTTEELAELWRVRPPSIYEMLRHKRCPIVPFRLSVGSRGFLRWSRAEAVSALQRNEAVVEGGHEGDD